MLHRGIKAIASVCRTFLLFLLGQAFLLVIVPLIVVLAVVPSILCRCLVILIARFRPDLDNIFTGTGILIAPEYVYRKPKCSILLHFILDGALPLDKLRTQFQLNVINDIDKNGNLRYPQLRQRWTQFLGYLFWKWDPSFSVNNHIKLLTDVGIELPSPCTEDDLKSVTSELLARPYDGGRSPWEVFVVPDYKSEGNKEGRKQTAIVFRIHHAMGDGYSILGMWLKLFNQERAKIPQINIPRLSLRQQIVRGLLLLFKFPVDTARFFINSVDGKNAWHLYTKLDKKYYTFFSDRINVADLKRIKNKFGVSYNAAVYSVTAGGIRRLMAEAEQRVPRQICAFLVLPLPGHPGGLTVHATGFSLKVDLTDPSPEMRLMKVSKSLKKMTETRTSLHILTGIFHLPTLLPIWILRVFYNKVGLTIGMTNFPGPEAELEVMNGVRLVDIIPALGHPAGRMGATAVMVSIGGRQRIALVLDRKLFEETQVPQNFARHVNDEVAALLSSCTRQKTDELNNISV